MIVTAAALAVFKRCGVPVITCVKDQLNTMTLSGVSGLRVSAGLQRTLTDQNGQTIDYTDYAYNGDIELKGELIADGDRTLLPLR